MAKVVDTSIIPNIFAHDGRWGDHCDKVRASPDLTQEAKRGKRVIVVEEMTKELDPRYRWRAETMSWRHGMATLEYQYGPTGADALKTMTEYLAAVVGYR